MAPATPADYSSMLMLLQRLNNSQIQQQQLANNNPPNLSTLKAAATLAMIAQQQQQIQSRNSADNNNNNATESLLMLAVHQLQQQQQQQQAQKCLSQWRQQFSAEINNNNNKNDLDQKSAFLSSPYQNGGHHPNPHHASLQHSLSANTMLIHSKDSAGGGYGSGDMSPPLAPSASTPRSAGDSSQLLLSSTISDCGTGADTPRTSATVIGSDEKPKRRSRLGGTSLKTAKVWRFFTQLPHPEQAATCQLCGKIIKATNSSTTGMIRHLRSCHPAEHKIVEDERRITLVQKTLKNVTSNAERAQLMQSYNMAAAGGGTPSADAMSSLLSQLGGTPASPSASAARPPPTTPLSSMTAFRHYSQQDDFKFAPSDAKSSPMMDSTFGGKYLNHVMEMLTKTQEHNAFNSTSTTLEQLEQFKANLAAQQSQFVTRLNNNDENNNKNVGTKPDDSGIGEHNDSEEDDEAPTQRVQPAGSTVATISPQIGATAITTPTKAQLGSDAANKHFGSTTAATAEDFTVAAAAAQTTTILADRRQTDDQEELHNDSTFSPIREDEDEPRDDEDDGNEDEEEDEEECVKTDEALVKPSPIFMRSLPALDQTSSQRGVKRQFDASSSSTWALSKPITGGWTQQQAKQLNDQIALMLLIDGAPVSIVDRVGFRELIRSLCPEHVMPSIEVFQREIIPALPARLGCDFATFRERLQSNNPLTSSDLLGDLPSNYSITDSHTGKLSPPVDMSESGFQDCEDVENRSPPPPLQQQNPVIGGGSLTMLSAQSLYAFDAKRARAHNPTAVIVKSEQMEAATVGINTGADDSALSSLSGTYSPPTSATDTNNNVDNGAAVLTA